MIGRTPNAFTLPVADTVFGYMLAFVRRQPWMDRAMKNGIWDKLPGRSLSECTLGVVGVGNIGKAVIRRARAFGMQVLAYDPHVPPTHIQQLGAEPVDLETLLRQSDFITLHCPLTPSTRHLIGARELSLMKPTAILINASRGPVIDEKALVAALKKGTIAAAGLDVFEKEPKLTPGLTKLDNVVLLPHIGSATEDTRNQMAVVAARNAIAMLKGKKPPNLVNPEVLTSRAYLQRIGRVE